MKVNEPIMRKLLILLTAFFVAPLASAHWGAGIPASITINGAPASLAKLVVTPLDPLYPGWSQWVAPQGPDAVLIAWAQGPRPVWVQLHNTTLDHQVHITTPDGFWSHAASKPVHVGEYVIDPLSGIAWYDEAWLETQVTSASNILDGSYLSDDAADYEDPKLHAITGSGNVDLESIWWSYTRTDGWSWPAVRFAAEYLAMQARRPEWSVGQDGQLNVLRGNPPNLKAYFQDAWKVNSDGLAFSDHAHFDTRDFLEIAEQRGWPWADWMLVGRVWTARQNNYYWRKVKTPYPYGGQTRVAAYLLASTTHALSRLRALPQLPGIVALADDLQDFQTWHADYIRESIPIKHPYGEGGGNEIMAAAKSDFWSCWQIGVLAHAAYQAGADDIGDSCLDWLEANSWDANSGAVYESVGVGGIDPVTNLAITAPGKATQIWPLAALYPHRPNAPLTKRLLALVPKGELKAGKWNYKFSIRLFGSRTHEVAAMLLAEPIGGKK